MTQLINQSATGADEVIHPEAAGEHRRSGSRFWVTMVVLGLSGVMAIGVLLWPRQADERLLLNIGGDTVGLVDPAGEALVYELENAVAAPDASRVYRATPGTESTELEEIDAATGDVVATQVVTGPKHIRVVSPTGDQVALMPDRIPATGLYEPQPRRLTTITVARNDGTPPRDYELEGNYEPETFSLDGDTLFLIEFWPPLQPDRYFVRHLDLITGEIVDRYSPEVELDPEMRGRARGQVIAPDGRFLYTLYTLESGDAPIHDPAVGVGGERWAFVHVLDLDEEISVCIFLPEPFGTGHEAEVGLGISPDGSRLFVVDSSTSSVATIDATAHVVERVDRLDRLASDEANSRPAVAVVDGDTFFVTNRGWSILRIEVREEALEVVDALATGGYVAGLNLSRDGSQLRIAAMGRILVYDLESGREIASIAVPGAAERGFDFVGAVSGTVQRIPIECAC